MRVSSQRKPIMKLAIAWILVIVSILYYINLSVFSNKWRIIKLARTSTRCEISKEGSAQRVCKYGWPNFSFLGIYPMSKREFYHGALSSDAICETVPRHRCIAMDERRGSQSAMRSWDFDPDLLIPGHDRLLLILSEKMYDRCSTSQWLYQLNDNTWFDDLLHHLLTLDFFREHYLVFE